MMVAALVIVLSFLNRDAMRVAAFLGGLGFGTFIDEVGKFVTKDNDYFFEPAFSLMYMVFIALVLVSNAISRRLYTPEEYLVNAIQELEELALLDLDARERGRALRLLDRCDPAHPLVAPLRELLLAAPLVPTAKPGPYARLRTLLRSGYDLLTGRPHFGSGLVLFFCGWLVLKLVYGTIIVFFPGLLPSEAAAPPRRLVQRMADLSFADWGLLASTVLSAGFVALGVGALASSRRFAYRMFKRAVLITIFITQVFIFYREQLSAVVGLALNALLLIVLQAAIDLESQRGMEDSPAESRRTPHPG
jgi:hypothetical protein